MSSSLGGTTPSTQSSSPQLPAVVADQVIEAFIQGIKPSVYFIIIGTIFSSMLVPLLIMLLYFSDTRTRKAPIFLLSMLDIVLGLTVGIWNATLETLAIVAPFKPIPQSNYVAFNNVYLFSAWIAEITLLARLLVVYPPGLTSKLKLIQIFTFPVLMKVARLIVLIMFNVQWQHDSKNLGSVILAAQQTWGHTPYTKIEWTLQIFDNACLSGLFLWKLRTASKDGARAGRVEDERKGSIRMRIQTLFWIAASNFVFPVIFNIIQLVILFHDSDFFVGTYVLMVNIYVTVFSVVFATVWPSTFNYKQRAFQNVPGSALGNAMGQRSATCAVYLGRTEGSGGTTPDLTVTNTLASENGDSVAATQGKWKQGWGNTRNSDSDERVIPLQILVQKREIVV